MGDGQKKINSNNSNIDEVNSSGGNEFGPDSLEMQIVESESESESTGEFHIVEEQINDEVLSGVDNSFMMDESLMPFSEASSELSVKDTLEEAPEPRQSEEEKVESLEPEIPKTNFENTSGHEKLDQPSFLSEESGLEVPGF